MGRNRLSGPHRPSFHTERPAYKTFHQKLIPDVENFIGIRTPAVKALAKEIARGNAESFLRVSKSDYYEQSMLEGLVIGTAKCDFNVFGRESLPLSRKSTTGRSTTASVPPPKWWANILQTVCRR